MEYILVITVVLSLSISFFCSLSEAALFAVPLAHVKHLAEEGSNAGKLLEHFKGEIAQPISAILILNTIANTTGPAVGGVAAEALFGQVGVIVFAVGMSAAVLFVGEIIPKFLGVTYSKQIAPIVARPLYLSIKVLSPLISVSKWVTTRIEPDEEQPSVSHQEVLTMAALGTEEGTLDHLEGSIISNVIGLDKVLVRDLLTPRVMVFRIEESQTLGELQSELSDWNFSRIPLIYLLKDLKTPTVLFL
jgi:CBS domain containing-hemolysin-like protein